MAGGVVRAQKLLAALERLPTSLKPQWMRAMGDVVRTTPVNRTDAEGDAGMADGECPAESLTDTRP